MNEVVMRAVAEQMIALKQKQLEDAVYEAIKAYVYEQRLPDVEAFNFATVGAHFHVVVHVEPDIHAQSLGGE